MPAFKKMFYPLPNARGPRHRYPSHFPSSVLLFTPSLSPRSSPLPFRLYGLSPLCPAHFGKGPEIIGKGNDSSLLRTEVPSSN